MKALLILFFIFFLAGVSYSQKPSEYDWVRTDITYKDSIDNDEDTLSRFWTDSSNTLKKVDLLTDTDKPFFKWFLLTIENISDSTMEYSSQSDFPSNKTFSLEADKSVTMGKYSVTYYPNFYFRKKSTFAGKIGYQIICIGY